MYCDVKNFGDFLLLLRDGSIDSRESTRVRFLVCCEGLPVAWGNHLGLARTYNNLLYSILL